MHGQSKTCNRPVDEELQLVSSREPFDRSNRTQKWYKQRFQSFSGTSPSGMYIIKVIFKVISFFQWAWRIFILPTIKSSDLNLVLAPRYCAAGIASFSKGHQPAPVFNLGCPVFVFFLERGGRFSSPSLCPNRWNTVKAVGSDGNTSEPLSADGTRAGSGPDKRRQNEHFWHMRCYFSELQTFFDDARSLVSRKNTPAAQTGCLLVEDLLLMNESILWNTQTPIWCHSPTPLCAEQWRLSQQLLGERQEYTLDWSPVHHKTRIHKHTSFSDTLTPVFVDC